MRAGLATNMSTITGLRTYAEIPDDPMMPAAVVQLGSVTYNSAFAKGLTEYSFVGDSDFRSACHSAGTEEPGCTHFDWFGFVEDSH
jgi:hypothetical protein